MVFNSVHFVVFFAVVYGLYRVLPHRAQNWLLLAASYYFYAAFDWRFLGLLAGSTLVDFVAARVIARSDKPGKRRIALGASLAWNLSVLGFFKYFNFFAENVRALFAWAGWRADFVTIEVLLPVGISFYTFITLGYVIDVYRRQVEPATSLLHYALFLAYFPHLVAGPILRASLLLPQIGAMRTVTAAQVREGLWLILWGYFKKMVVADNLARMADEVFRAQADPGGLHVLLGVYAFAFQVYGDFSGYTDIARGTSKLMGIELGVNFRFPYFVRTPAQFWQHWHISLSAWLRDYVFLPVSYALSRRADGIRWLGLKDEFWIYAGASMATMLVAGLWHGAAWTFVLWGAFQGLLLVGYRLPAGYRRPAAGYGLQAAGHGLRAEGAGLRAPAEGPATANETGDSRRNGQRRRSAGPGRRSTSSWRIAFEVVTMFHLTCLGWLIFRADSLAQAGDLISRLIVGFSPSWSVLLSFGSRLAFYTAPLIALHALEARRDDLTAVFSLPRAVRYSIYAALVYFIVLFGDFAGAQFIYFQF
ncbi:MAG: MBOAT family protein [Vicinamibacterales bacterium]